MLSRLYIFPVLYSKYGTSGEETDFTPPKFGPYWHSNILYDTENFHLQANDGK